MELDNDLKQELMNLIKEGKPIPIHFKSLLFPLDKKPKEYELVYGIKEREEDILAETMAIPFQPVKQFGKAKEGEWHNKLVFGDNLQVLKYLLKLKNEGKLTNSDGTQGIKLCYIDPPFATEKEMRLLKGDIKAYNDKVTGAKFIEFIRKRLVLIYELLTDDGSIFVHLDQKKVHYIKVVLDEIFGENNFQNEIIWEFSLIGGNAKKYEKNHESILYYVKSSDKFIFNKDAVRQPYSEKFLIGLKKDDKGYYYSRGLGRDGEFLNRKAISYINPLGKSPSDIWNDVNNYSPTGDEKVDYPTQKPEKIISKVILGSSNPGDIVLDCFAGSGTTGAVAEKLGRRWIMADCGKLAIYTIIKRMHSLKEEIGNKGKDLKPKPFVLYNAGLYADHDILLKMGSGQYQKFALELFQCEPKEQEINGLKMDGVLLNCPVRVFSQEGYLTEEYIDELHNTVGASLKSRMFIIAPASRVYFLQDYIEKGGIRYYILRIPYSVIDEIHKKAFTRLMQPTSSSEINQNIEATGFDFIHPPEVKAEYRKIKPKDKLTGFMGGEELVIEIKKFESVQRSKEPMEFQDPKDALSMVFVDRDYNGEYFNMTDYVFADDIKKQDYKIRIPATTGDKIMIIYLDILGNERIEVKKASDFKKG